MQLQNTQLLGFFKADLMNLISRDLVYPFNITSIIYGVG